MMGVMDMKIRNLAKVLESGVDPTAAYKRFKDNIFMIKIGQQFLEKSTSCTLL